ncbi:MAG: sulfatase-like hydrolase/transferase [Thermodesulfovibrionales bacterium]|nr:sulfatase-like hydrolase/transferase [Thermodesulfovibrionales bacterium]
MVKNKFHCFVLLGLVNTFLSLLISRTLTQYWEGNIFLEAIAFLANYLMLNLLPAIFLYFLSFITGKVISFFINVIFYTLLQAILIIDIKIYSLFRFHLNSLVWNVITVEGVSDSVTLGSETIIFFIIIILLITVIEVALNLYIKKLNSPAIEKLSRISFVTALLLICLDKGLYAYGDLMNKTEITKNSRLYPLYQPFTVKRFASKVLGMNVNREEGLKLNTNRKALNYPKRPLRFENQKNFNILIIAVEGLRFDMLDPEIMPEVWRFSKEAVVFRNHYSGGNGSRFGIFSLLYGLSGTYWHSFLANRISPVLIDALMEKNYEFLILSSTRLTFPEFRKTAFVRIPEAITDTFDTGLSYERDRIITERFLDFISKRERTRPFFSFMFFDSSHQPYLYPEEFEKFQPVVEDNYINYFRDVSKDRVHLIRNRYKNAIHYEDHLIGRIISGLKEKRLLKNTIVVITGDHGEEFYENGYLGHTSAFNDYQNKVVFVLWHPEAEPAIRENLTSHLDIVPTIMRSLGCLNPYEDYSQGISLLEKSTRPFVITANWDTAALIDEEYRIIFSTESHRGIFEVRTGNSYSIIKNADRIIRERLSILRTALQMLSEFYR